MNSKAHLSNLTNFNQISPDCDSVKDELEPVTQEASSNGESVDPIENKTTIVDGIRTNDDGNMEVIYIKTEIKLENIDFEEDCPGTADEKPEDICME